MKSGPLHCLLDKPDGRIDLLGHVPNRKVRIALEVIPHLPCVHGAGRLCFSSAVSSPLGRLGLLERFYHTGHGRIDDSKLFRDPPVGLAWHDPAHFFFVEALLALKPSR